jgi:hypothetical protein
MKDYIRFDNEAPKAIAEWGWKYHHIGIPASFAMPGETYLPEFKVYVSGFNTSPFGIEWMRYEKDSPIAEKIKAVPHIAFEVTDIEKEIHRENFKIITPPNSPSDGCRVAMIEHNGAIIELIQFEK